MNGKKREKREKREKRKEGKEEKKELALLFEKMYLLFFPSRRQPFHYMWREE